MKIALIGYGKMGKAIEEIAISRGHTISLRLTSKDSISTSDFSSTDVAIEFTRPDSVLANIDFCVGNNIPIVVGTTAWNQHLPEITEKVKQHKSSLLHASNFSIGVTIFLEINRILAKIMNNQPDYTPMIEEIHHLQKLDSPSGTAITIANGLLAENTHYTNWKSIEMNELDLEKEPDENTIEKFKKDELPILCFREPDVPGTHLVSYRSEVDTIQISHQAHNRKGFALGAVLSAEFLLGKTGVYTIQDVLKQSI